MADAGGPETTTQTRLLVVGKVSDWKFHKMRLLAQQASAKDATVELETRAVLPVDYAETLTQMKRKLGGAAFAHPYGEPIAVVDGAGYLGPLASFEKWARAEFGVRDPRPYALHNSLAKAAYRKALGATGYSHVYLDVEMDGPYSAAWRASTAAVGGSVTPDPEAAGDEDNEDSRRRVRLVFELYDDVAPKSAANFRSLVCGDVEGLSYVDSLFHRVVPGGWIQGGDISDGSPGDGGTSVFGETFEDETFAVEHLVPGIVGYANTGPHSNQSQFYITLGAMPAFDCNFVAFGRVIDGFEGVKTIADLPAINQRPLRNVTIVSGGEFTP